MSTLGRQSGCDHLRVVKPARPIPDWTSAPCPDCGERCKHGSSPNGLITVRENNERVAAQRPEARIATLQALLIEARDLLGAVHLVEDGPNARWVQTSEHPPNGYLDEDTVDSPTCPVCAMERKIDAALADLTEARS